MFWWYVRVANYLIFLHFKFCLEILNIDWANFCFFSFFRCRNDVKSLVFGLVVPVMLGAGVAQMVNVLLPCVSASMRTHSVGLFCEQLMEKLSTQQFFKFCMHRPFVAFVKKLSSNLPVKTFSLTKSRLLNTMSSLKMLKKWGQTASYMFSFNMNSLSTL